MDFGIADKKALVTGAARGIGRAEAQALAAEGGALAINDIDAAGAPARAPAPAPGPWPAPAMWPRPKAPGRWCKRRWSNSAGCISWSTMPGPAANIWGAAS